MLKLIFFAAFLAATSASILQPTDHQSCREPGTRCSGASGYPAVTWIPCCSGGCTESKYGQWGKFCSGKETTTSTGTTAPSGSPIGDSVYGRCYPEAYRCQGASGRPFVEYKPCCGDGNCVDAPDWGKWCVVPCYGGDCNGSTPNLPVTPTPSPTLPPPDDTTTATQPPPTVAPTPMPGVTPTPTSLPGVTPTPTPTVDTTTEPPSTGPCEGLGGKTRPDAGSISQEDWNCFVSGINGLKSKPSSRYPGISVLDEFSRLHRDFGQHFGANFLMWHRVMLWEFEKELNTISPGCRIPAYDWAREGGNTLTSSLFQNDRAGGSQPFEAGNAKPILGGSFEGLTTEAEETDNEQPVLRNFRLTQTLHDTETISSNSAALTTYAQFNAWLEGVHGNFHVAIGGTMNSLMYSPSEPRYAPMALTHKP